MCEVMERYEQKAVTKANINAIKFMITTLNASKEQILQQYSEYEYNEALNELSKNKREVCNYLKGPSQTEVVLFFSYYFVAKSLYSLILFSSRSRLPSVTYTSSVSSTNFPSLAVLIVTILQ